MRRKSDAPSRNEVTEQVEKKNTDMSEKVEELDTIATDSETVRDTLEGLDFGGTAEGADEVEGAIEKAGEVTAEVFEREDETLDEIQSAGEEFEAELTERSDTVESDVSKISDTSSRLETKEAAAELARAQEAAASDVAFLNEQNEKARQVREENERLQQGHRGRVQGGRR